MRRVTEFFDHSTVSSGNGINLFISKSPTNRKFNKCSGIVLLKIQRKLRLSSAKESDNVP